MKNHPSLKYALGILILWLCSLNPAFAGLEGALIVKHSNKCLSVPSNSFNNGQGLVQATCSSQDNQFWQLKPYQDAYQVVVRHSGLCLNVNGASTASGAQVIQWPCVGANNELWYARPKGNYYQLVAKHSGKCLNVYGAFPGDNTQIIQWDCVGADNELWAINQPTIGQILGQPSGSIAAKHSGKCLEIPGRSSNNGTVATQSNCNGFDNQQWTLLPWGDGYAVLAKHSGMCLAVLAASQANGGDVVQWPCADVDNFIWYARPKGDYFQLVAKHSGKCLNVYGAGQANSTKIIQWNCEGADNELWNIGALSHTSITNKGNNQCIDVFGGYATDGNPIINWPCHGASNQQWTLMPYQDAFKVVSKRSNLCLTVPGASPNANQALVQSACTGVNNQLWYPRANGKFFTLVAKHSNLCLNSTATNNALTQNTCNNQDNQLWAINNISANGGKWSKAKSTSIVPVAAANLPNGQLLLWAAHERSNFGGYGKTYTNLFDPITQVVTERLVTETGHDMFCPGTSNLADGRILVNGGSDSYKTSIYDASTGTWLAAQNMNIPRGYQGNTVLSNGEVLTLGGSWSGGYGGKNGEIWNANNGWRVASGITVDSILTADPQGIFRQDNHAWLFNVGNQHVLHAGPSKQMNLFNTAGNGSSTALGNRLDDADSMNGNAIMYDVGKILKVGGATAYLGAFASDKSYALDILAGLKTTQTNNLAYARAYNSSVVLPGGQVIVFGGQQYTNAFTDVLPVLAPELWDPSKGSFTTLAPMRIPRTYHSLALLMPDARVFVAGGGLCGACEANHLDAEIFTPPYLLNADGSEAVRPVIYSAPSLAGYGGAITVNTDSAVAKFALVRLSSVTHSVNNDQRQIPLVFSTSGTNTFKVTIPSDSGVATPGYYMLFAMNSAGVPSVAKMIKIN